MTVNVSKPAINVREKLAELDKPTGIAGEAMLRAETPQEQFNLIGAGRRNLIINGDMRIAQRGTSAVTVSNNTYQSIDRWFGYESSAGAYTIEQSTGHTADTGFHNALKLSCTTATSSIGSTDYVALGYRVEAYDAAISGWGTSSAQDMVLSFWVRSSKTGTYGVSIEKQPTTLYRRVSSYTIDVANTWQKVVIPISALTFGGAIPTNTSSGIKLEFILAYGSTYTTSNLDTWFTSVLFSPTGQVNWLDSTSNDFYITGVQLEVGKVATPFEHRSYGEELALCLRYYWRVTKEKAYHNVTNMVAYDSSAAYGTLYYPVKMRAQPTFSHSSDNDFFVTGQSNNFTPVNMSASEITTWSSQLYGSTNGNYTQGSAYWLRFDSDNPSGQFFAFDAEL